MPPADGSTSCHSPTTPFRWRSRANDPAGRDCNARTERLPSMLIKFFVNGKPAEFDGPEDVPLLWVVREHLGLTGSKFGCGVGACGACTMHIDGAPTRTCIMPITMAQSRRITTI